LGSSRLGARHAGIGSQRRATLGSEEQATIPVDDRTETITPTSTRAVLPEVVGVVALFTEGLGAISKPLAVREEVTVGRGDQADLVLDDKKASRLHAALSPAAQGVMVRDLGSRNGTFVAGERVGDEPVVALVGTFFRIGNTVLRVVGDVAAFSHQISRGDELIGGPSLATIKQQVRHAASADLPVLIEGESGVGKELFAHRLHQQSERAGELVAVNCAAIPGELIEAELFGHTKGAFSGAEGTRIGLIRSADAGTLFLDEIGEMPLETQAKLLRVLEAREVRPVGEDRVQPVDVRFVSATNAPLADHVSEGLFREDLFHRIAAIRIVVPPLRERAEDVPMLVAHFAGHRLMPTASAMERLCAHRWPGNVRELRNAIQVAQHTAGPDAGAIAVEHLPASVLAGAPRSEQDDERKRYEGALAAAKGNIAEVARQLGMRRATVYEHLRRLDIDAKRFRR